MGLIGIMMLASCVGTGVRCGAFEDIIPSAGRRTGIVVTWEHGRCPVSGDARTDTSFDGSFGEWDSSSHFFRTGMPPLSTSPAAWPVLIFGGIYLKLLWSASFLIKSAKVSHFLSGTSLEPLLPCVDSWSLVLLLLNPSSSELGSHVLEVDISSWLTPDESNSVLKLSEQIMLLLKLLSDEFSGGLSPDSISPWLSFKLLWLLSTVLLSQTSASSPSLFFSGLPSSFVLFFDLFFLPDFLLQTRDLDFATLKLRLAKSSSRLSRVTGVSAGISFKNPSVGKTKYQSPIIYLFFLIRYLDISIDTFVIFCNCKHKFELYYISILHL